MSWKLWILVGDAVVLMVGVGMAARALVDDVVRNMRVGDVLRDHDAELRGLPGVVTIVGDLFETGYGESARRTLVVRLPTAARIWRPRGEGKDFISLADLRLGDTVAATLTAVPKAKARRATAADLEVYGPQ